MNLRRSPVRNSLKELSQRHKDHGAAMRGCESLRFF
jgi:hypothetical protein